MYGAAAPPRTPAQRAFWAAWQKRREELRERRRLAHVADRARIELERAECEATIREQQRLAEEMLAAEAQARLDAENAAKAEAARLAAEEKARNTPKPLDLAALIEGLHR